MKKENSLKSRGGLQLENQFSQRSKINKLSQARKPKFINEWGDEQVIDSDFCLETQDETIFFDLTTSFRSDRAKQKAYNGLCCKMQFGDGYKFYIVIPDDEYHGKYLQRTKQFSLQGLDGVLSLTQAIKMVQDKGWGRKWGGGS